jgi:hypothetical protein
MCKFAQSFFVTLGLGFIKKLTTQLKNGRNKLERLSSAEALPASTQCYKTFLSVNYGFS